MKNLSLTFMMTVAVALFSCSTESESTPEAQVGVEFNTVKSALTTQAISKETPLKQAAAGTLSFSTGHIAISRLEFEAETDNDSIEIEFELKQNTLIDFATGTTTPDINFISIPAGNYEEVEVEIELSEGSEQPAILLFGTYVAPDGVEHNIRFEFNSEETFEVEREGLISFGEAQVAIAQITFDPVAWFISVTDEQYANATKNEEGVIVVSSTENTEIFDVVADGLDLASDVEMEDDEDDQDEE
ncbi:hypothetical protein SAMN04488034_10732 [Salinimicrobium catena]|uniref:DUF4382 domain-containing protein n=1 Tax=Salinimicrobium catena TaxID=390640 RepID=A0A1H5NYZ9_9FLAO|nr:hypothetical protein [Salinimicrobium catena]SDL64268.1 hypothetical protein SAMN04488140_10754 [Salinimicrobium catena]SEF06826.1 hypothetical protein SAMN04488034_10732 [Salinimicrobium catena]